MQYADLTKMTTKLNEKVYVIANESLRTLKKNAPELVVPILMLAMPRREVAWGQCAICPDGLPLIKKVGWRKPCISKRLVALNGRPSHC